MNRIQTAAEIQFQRARMYALVVAGIGAVFIPLGIVDGLTAGSWTTVGLVIGSVVVALLYRAVLQIQHVRPLTLGFLFLQLICVAGAVHNTAGFLSHVFALYILLLFGIGFVLVERWWIAAATGLTLVVAIVVGILEMSRTLPPNKQAAIFLQTSQLYQIFALVGQGLAIIGAGTLIIVVMQLVQRREQELEQSRQETTQRSTAMLALTDNLESANSQLQASEEALRSTVDALTMTALPIGEGTLVLPLIGAFDASRADLVVRRLLDAVHQQRAHTVILDLTGVRHASPTLTGMLLRLIGGVRLLGARMMLAGLQPELAPHLVQMNVDLSAIVSAPTLAAALQTAAR